MYGKRYAGEFRTEIEELFLRGERKKAHKLGPGAMVEVLRSRYLGRFDLPTENEIRQEIAKIRQRKTHPSQRLPVAEVIREQTTPNPAMRPRDAVKFFSNLLDSEPHTKPKTALERFRAVFGDDGLTDQQVKSKFSSVKTQCRKGAIE